MSSAKAELLHKNPEMEHLEGETQAVIRKGNPLLVPVLLCHWLSHYTAVNVPK